ncbi:MAG TPA: hypothetical protein VFU13_06580 [Steroidobacteraceae bacterium]|nr:hypothetical protein [Steroidobacteraceae bacterium]
MNTTNFRRALAVIGLACMAATAYAKPSGNWRIEFNHVADNDGVIVLRIAPVEGGGEPIEVETKIPKGTTENRVADLVATSLKATLGSKNYRIGTDDGEDVVIKKRGKTKNFELTMVSTSLTGLEIKVKHN